MSPSVSGGFGDLSLDVDEKLKSQACDRDADATGRAARDTKLTATVKAAQAEATAAWAKLGPQAEACTKLTAASERESCAKTVDAFVSRAEALTVSLGAGTERVVTECGTREPAYAAVSQKVSVAEVSLARAAAAVLRKAPTVGGARPGDWTSPTLGAMKWIPAGTFTMAPRRGSRTRRHTR